MGLHPLTPLQGSSQPWVGVPPPSLPPRERGRTSPTELGSLGAPPLSCWVTLSRSLNLSGPPGFLKSEAREVCPKERPGRQEASGSQGLGTGLRAQRRTAGY